jgi:ankyrin repeat protein
MIAQDIHAACKSGNILAIEEAIDLNPSKLDEKDPKVLHMQLGWSPLYRIVSSGKIEAARYLLSRGADANIPNNLGEIPLHSTADKGDCQMAELLIEYGSDVNFQQNEGDTPLHYSVFQGSLQMIKLLLENKADPNIKSTKVRIIIDW